MKKYIIIIVLVIVSTVLYSRFITINTFKINEYTVENTSIPSSFNGLNIVHFSDMLYNEYYSMNKLKDLVIEINKLDPDIVFFTGDLIDNDYKPDDKLVNNITNELSKIEAKLHKFAIIGDNDIVNIDVYKTILDDSNFILLDNKSYPLFYDSNEPIIITGLTDVNSLNDSYTIDETISSNYNITLIHKPDFIDNVNQNVSLFISGHSLGGYVRVPLIGSLADKDGSKKYQGSYFHLDDREIYISNGLGVEKFPFRLFNTPSINLYRLKK